MFGNPKGLSELLKSNGCVTLHLIPEVDPKSADGWKPSGFGDLMMPGSDEKRRVSIPDLRSLVGNPDVFDSESDRPAKTVEDISPDALWEAARERLNQVWQMPTTPEPSEPSPEPLNQPNSEGFSDSDKRFTPLNLTREQALELIQSLNPELNQTQIIERLWRVKKGGSAAWKEAYAQFKELTGGGDD